MKLPALEKNILVYRSIQMSLFLYYSESVRRLLVGSAGRVIKQKANKDLKGAKLMKSIFESLVEDNILTVKERKELESLIDHRNTIAHDISQLTGDIEIPGRQFGFKNNLRINYDYDALDRMKRWKDSMWKRLAPMYVLPLGMDSIRFEAAESAFTHELAALRKRIDRQYQERINKI